MHTKDHSAWSHSHKYGSDSSAAERGTRAVLWITAITMVVEIVAGWVYNSMALLADGWHMSSHTLAIGLSVLAYAAARRYADDPRFTFSTWKIEVLGGFASAVMLLGVAGMMVFASVERLVSPEAIHYPQAIAVAVLGLLVNLLCALILGKAHGHGDHHSHGHVAGHSPDDEEASRAAPRNKDLNLRSAYVHVLTDAATSVLAIIALLGGWHWGWAWLDPLTGIAGAVLVAIWARRLIIDTGNALLDREMDHPVVAEIREVVETGSEEEGTRIADLHVWRIGRSVYACALTVVTHDSALTASDIRERLSVHAEVVHATIEVHRCPNLP